MTWNRDNALQVIWRKVFRRDVVGRSIRFHGRRRGAEVRAGLGRGVLPEQSARLSGHRHRATFVGDARARTSLLVAKRFHFAYRRGKCIAFLSDSSIFVSDGFSRH